MRLFFPQFSHHCFHHFVDGNVPHSISYRLTHKILTNFLKICIFEMRTGNCFAVEVVQKLLTFLLFLLLALYGGIIGG